MEVCVICWQNMINAILLPCMHMALCSEFCQIRLCPSAMRMLRVTQLSINDSAMILCLNEKQLQVKCLWGYGVLIGNKLHYLKLISLQLLFQDSETLPMSYFYSETVQYCECIMPREIGWEVINELGEMECVHFENKSINYDNPYYKSFKRCEDSLGKINDIKKFIYEIKPDFKAKPVGAYKDLLKEFRQEVKAKKVHGYLYINHIEDEIKEVHEYLARQKGELETLNKDLNEKILNLAMFITLTNSEDFRVISKQKSLLNNANIFDYKCILISKKDQRAIEKGLFRISRGNSWTKILPINRQKVESLLHKEYGLLQQKVVCIILFQFGENNSFLNKMNKYISCMEATTISLTIQKWDSAMSQLEAQIKEIQNLQGLINDAVERYLYKLSENYENSQFSCLTFMQAYVQKEKQIYYQLACTKASQNFLHFSVFIPLSQLPLKLNLNQKLPPLTLTPKQCSKKQPTKIQTNSIMSIPQQILDTYGVPSYGQFNPAPLYIVTFAFFIGVMFGDVGHMLMAIPFLIYFKVNTWAWLVVFFMGYCGIIYNEFLGLNLGLFSSCYGFPDNEGDSPVSIAIRLNEDCVFPMGIDSIWKRAENQMQFTNSFKMKLAVIFGVAHMLLGICLRILNTVRQRNWVSLFTLAIPQLIFMLCTFFYMDVMIIIKWAQNYHGQLSKNAPSIISTMITVYAGFGESPLLFWPEERHFEKFLVVTAYSMVPIMLFGIPLCTYIQRRRSGSILRSDPDNADFNELIDEKIDADLGDKNSEEEISDKRSNPSIASIDSHHHEPLQEIFVHSFIESIEFVLGTVSNTASYLRLWALSLAHAQLSEVIFNLILEGSISGGYSKIVPAFFAFIFFYSVTFGVLICMDTMECFLHSLRLHWVEFQNKFYEGKGYKFEPFSFKAIETETTIS